MRLANLNGRAAILSDGGAVDIAEASGGRFGPDVQALYDDWEAVRAFVDGMDHATARPFSEDGLGAPAPRPRQVFAIGLNYRSHAEESGMAVSEIPITFTKFPASITGPFAEVELPGDTVDWEVELVVVIGALADRVAAADAWGHVAGLTIGQDLSERTVQFAAGNQFSLGKSYRGFGPMGPALVTPDELADPNDLGLGCSVDGVTVQDARTSDLIFSVPQLIAELSAVLPLLPGDVIFTGTPGGVGMAAQPPRFLKAGETLESWIEGIGSIRNTFVDTPPNP